MRGKISYYNEKMQTGMVVDKARIVYEFKRANWFDQHRLPAADMYVDFKANELGRIEQIKESDFVKLQRKYDITENDFWQSKDEEALEDVAVARRERLINDGILSIAPKSIPEDYAIADCFLAYFADSVELIYRYEDLAFSESEEDGRLDYFKLKRFMLKAKAQLVQSDGTVDVEPFNTMERQLFELEFVALETLKNKNKTMETLFEEIYLSQQIGFLRMEKRLKLDSQKAFELSINIKRAVESINMWQTRLKTERNQEYIASMNEKIERMAESKRSAEEQLQTIEKNKALFAGHIKHFKEAKYAEFVNNFGFEGELKGVVDTLKKVIGHIAFRYDTLLWQCAVNSNIIRNTFFRQTSVGNFCSATFLRYYLKPLDKRLLSKPDEALYGYLTRYDRDIAKHVLVLSEHKDVIEEVSMMVYGNYKDAVVHQFHRAVDSLHWLKGRNAAMAVFDEQNRALTPEELAESYVAAHPDIRFVILVFNSKKNSKTKFSANIEIWRLGGLYAPRNIEAAIAQILTVSEHMELEGLELQG